MTEIQLATAILSTLPHAPVVLELGAHHGHDTVELYDACQEQPTYIAVEADPRNIPVLLNRVGPREVRCAHYAVAAFNGTIKLNLSYGVGASGSSSIRKPKEHLKEFPGTTFDSAVNVPAVKLDTLSERYGIFDTARRVDLIWCDIQGAERDMIEGGSLTLARTQYLLCECDAIEMYEGQVTRDRLLDLLPGWVVREEWSANANVLLRNTAV